MHDAYSIRRALGTWIFEISICKIFYHDVEDKTRRMWMQDFHCMHEGQKMKKDFEISVRNFKTSRLPLIVWCACFLVFAIDFLNIPVRSCS